MEDVLLARFFAGEPAGRYIDVGAGHHSYHSVTKHFYDAGWSGINIEPRFDLWQLLCQERPRDVSLYCAVSDISGSATFFKVISPTFTGTDRGGLSTLDGKQAESYRKMGFIVEEIPMRTRTLSEILTEHNIVDIGFLKIDVEGFEFPVVKGLDLDRWRPRLILTESTTPMTDTVCDDSLQVHLSAANYHAAFFDGLNRYFVREEDASLLGRLAVPANVTDGYVLAEEHYLREENERKAQQIVELQSQLALYQSNV
jgi:FkbM family methyltransferase